MSVDSIGGTTVILGSSDIATLFGTPLNSGGTATFPPFPETWQTAAWQPDSPAWHSRQPAR